MKFLRRLFAGIRAKLLLLAVGGCITILMIGLYASKPAFLSLLDLKLYDVLLTKTHSKETTKVPVIVDIDEQTLEKLGQWPWPRYRLALLLGKVRNLGAASVGLDMVFAESDNTSPSVLGKNLKQDLNLDVGWTGLPDALADNDGVLAGVLGSGPFVLGHVFNYVTDAAEERGCTLHPLQASFVKTADAQANDIGLFTMPGVVCNISTLADAAPASGFFNTEPDRDGVIRRTPLFVEHDGKVYPSLSLATLIQAVGDPNCVIKFDALGITSARIGSTIVPLDAEGKMLINYRGAEGTFAYISALDILEDRTPREALEGKVVFVGTSAAGLKDLRVSPLDSVFPGVEVHANVVDNILSRDFLHSPDWAPGAEASAVLIAGLASTMLLAFAGALWSAVPIAAAGAGLWFGAAKLMQAQGIVLSPLYPFLTLLTQFTVLSLLKFRQEEGHKKFIHSTFKSYLSPELIDDMVKNKTMPELGGQAKQISAYFTDIQSFSTFSEKLTAPQLVELLNEYLSAMTDILIAEGGTLDKYEGDAIIAFFGAPMDMPDHAYRACATAVAMQGALAELRDKWKGESAQEGEERNTKNLAADQWAPGAKWPAIVHDMKMRIGINCGEIVVGNMGSSMRMNYTMMGDAVNLAARLEEAAKQYGIFTALSGSMLTQPAVDESGRECKVQDLVEVRLVDRIIVVGKSEPVGIYELCALKGGLSESEKQLFQLFGQGFELYTKMQWDEAVAVLEEAETYERFPHHKTTPSRVLMERCRQFKENPPVPVGETWDGVIRLTKK
jgi:adenylate cyclase